MPKSPSKHTPPSKGPSPKLVQMLRDATPEQRKEAARVTASLLLIKARKNAVAKG